VFGLVFGSRRRRDRARLSLGRHGATIVRTHLLGQNACRSNHAGRSRRCARLTGCVSEFERRQDSTDCDKCRPFKTTTQRRRRSAHFVELAMGNAVTARSAIAWSTFATAASATLLANGSRDCKRANGHDQQKTTHDKSPTHSTDVYNQPYL
jgi:hypothetical protein